MKEGRLKNEPARHAPRNLELLDRVLKATC